MQWCATTACFYKFFLDWQSLIAGVLALFGAWITIRALDQQFRRGLTERQRVASMQIATQLRRWLIATSRAFDLGPNRVAADLASIGPNDNPEDYVFPTPSDIPKFPFEESVENISLLPSDDAQTLLNIMERRASAEWEAVDTWEFGSGDKSEITELFEARIAAVYVDCSEFYAKLAKDAGWKPIAVTEQDIKDMQERAAKLDEIRNRPSVGIDLSDFEIGAVGSVNSDASTKA